MTLEPSQLVAERYRLVEPLGSGGMGSVWKALQVDSDEAVALKVLLKASNASETSLERFRREARAARAIESPFVARLLDMLEDPNLGVVLVFEFLRGESLVERLRRSGPIPFDSLWSVVESIWLGLCHAHAAGIVHRDLKPSNIFLRREPSGVKILDFGISKLPKVLGDDSITREGQNLGTFAFMPPEQMNRAREADERADIYACTTLIFQALSGHLPYATKNLIRLMELKRTSPARPLADVVPTKVPDELQAFLTKGLQRDAKDRFQSAQEALDAWRALRPEMATSPAEDSPHDSPIEPPPASRTKVSAGLVEAPEPTTTVMPRSEAARDKVLPPSSAPEEPETAVFRKKDRSAASSSAIHDLTTQVQEPSTTVQTRKADDPEEGTAVWRRGASEGEQASSTNPPVHQSRWQLLLLAIFGYVAVRALIHLLN